MNSDRRYQELRREIDTETLLARACAETGLHDFGDADFRETFAKFLDFVAREVDFNAQGVDIFTRDVMRCLVNRLRVHRDLALHPEILDEDVEDPIIIFGLGRSGTTKLQKMLSAPDEMQKMYFWRIWNPARLPGEERGDPAARIALANQAHMLSSDKPGLDAAHHIEEQEVDEDWVLLMLTFEEWSWANMLPMPSYFDWLMGRPAAGPFRYLKMLVQYLQWQDGGKRGRKWVMKGIGYIANLDALLMAFPKATLVHTHRHPYETIASYAKFEANVWPIQSKPLDPRFIGSETLRMWRIAMDRYLEARQRLGLDDCIIDVKYEQIRSDPLAAIRRIYERAGLAWNAAAENKMQAWHDSNEQGRFGKHEYSLAEFGLREADIDAAFGNYIRRFIDD